MRLKQFISKLVMPLSFASMLSACSLVASVSDLIAPSTSEKIKVSLDITSLSMSEGSAALINVTLSDRRPTPTVVDVSLSSVRNDVASDFMPLPVSVTIPANSISAPLLLTSNQDAIYETNENFSLYLYTSDSSVAVERDNTQITILDDDAIPVVNFAALSQNISEGAGTGTIIATLDHPSAFPIVVPVTATNGTASNSDYALSSSDITFAPGEVSKAVSFTVNDDAISETAETFSVALTAGTSVVTLGSSLTHTVNIVDNESTQLSIDDVTVTEGGNLVFTVTLSVASLSTVQFDWATSAGTAVNTVNYNNASGSESVNAGTVTRTITIPTINTAAICEADRTVTVTLTNPVNASIADGTAVGTITDDDLPSLSVASSSALESSPVTLTASLSAACATKTVSFTWSNAAGTATPVTDYGVITNQSATIAAGSTTASLVTSVVNDSINEGNETFTVTLSNLTNATAGTVTATGTITDDDVPLPFMLKEFNGAPADFSKVKMVDGRVIFVGGANDTGKELWVSDGTAPGTFALKDIYAGPSSPTYSNFILDPVSNLVYFTANAPPYGNEIWRTDGTQAGTFIVKDLNPGSGGISATILGSLGGRLIFTALFSSTTALFSSDGTPAGTIQIGTGISFVNFSGGNGSVFGGEMYFGAGATGVGASLWKTDGTDAGTVHVASIEPLSNAGSPSNFFHAYGKLFFNATTNVEGEELWVSDGTTAGTALFKAIGTGANNAYAEYMGEIGGKVVFGAYDTSNKIWVTDGTAAGTVSISPVRHMEKLGELPGKIIFVANEGTQNEPWVTDGTAAGTFLLKDIYAGASNSSVVYSGNIFATINNKVVFVADDGVSGQEPWVTDGTSAGTVRLKDIHPGLAPSYPEGLTVVGNKIVFAATSPSGREIWETDGTSAGTVQVIDANPGSENLSPNNFVAMSATEFFFTGFNPNVQGATVYMGDLSTSSIVAVDPALVPTHESSTGGFAALGTSVLFDAANNGPGNPIWKTDGTTAGTTKVKDIYPSLGCTDVSNMISVGSSVFFTANSLGSYFELWTSDGTPAGTQMTMEIYPGDTSGASDLVQLGSKVVFKGNTSANGWEPWVSDGTAAGTMMLKDTYAGSTSGVQIGAPIKNSAQGLVYFVADAPSSKKTLWVTDGTPAGTVQINAFGTVASLTIVNSNTLTIVATATTIGADSDLWVTNGTNVGTIKITPTGVKAVQSIGRWGAFANSRFYFIGKNSAAGSELWSTNGTLAGTVLAKDITAGTSSSYFDQFQKLGNGVVFGVNALGTWYSDGTSAGTVQISTSSFSNGRSIEFAGKVYFVGYDPSNGEELWETNGTLAGTSLVKDINPGTANSVIQNLTLFNSKIYFSASDGVHGAELWESDGTAAGTKMVSDANPGEAPTTPSQLTVINGKLFYLATTTLSGKEVWVYAP